MKLKFLVDVGVGRKVEESLSEKGFDTKAVREINPSLPDLENLKIAQRENRFIITMDKDFGELVFHSYLSCKGVLLLREENVNGVEKVKVVNKIFEKYSDKLQDNFCVFQKDKFRIRKLRK